MSNNIPMGCLLIIIALLISAISQVLLKLSARKAYLKAWQEYINPFVVAAYTLYFITTLLSVIALRYTPLTLAAALDSAGQIFVPVMSYLFLHEKISKRKGIGMGIIVVGILAFAA